MQYANFYARVLDPVCASVEWIQVIMSTAVRSDQEIKTN